MQIQDHGCSDEIEKQFLEHFCRSLKIGLVNFYILASLYKSNDNMMKISSTPCFPSAPQSLAARTKITFDFVEGPSLRTPGGPSLLGGASLFSSSSFHLTIFSFFLLLFCPGEKPFGLGDLVLAISELSFSILTPVCEKQQK